MTNAVKKFLSKIVPEDVGGSPRTVGFHLGNGLKVIGTLDELPAAIVERLAIHGMAQKVGDAAAGFSKDGDYSGAFSAMQAVYDNLVAGLWNAKGTSGRGDLAAAVAELQGMDIDTATELVGGMNEETLKAVAAHPEVKAVVKRLQAERAAAVAETADVPSLGDLLKPTKVQK